jgi:DNA repair protein RadC
MSAAPTPRPYVVPIYKVSLVRDGRLATAQPQLRCSADAAELFRAFLGNVDREHFMVAMLDRKHRLIGANLVHVGTIDGALVNPRDVFKPALLCNAVSIVLCHNRPSGDCQPSREDRALTQRLKEAGKLLDVTVLDHIILGDGTNQYLSFADEDYL